MTALPFPLVVLALVQTAVLVAATVLMAIAARGYAGTPWGRVLRPLPVALLFFAASTGLSAIQFNSYVPVPSTPVLWVVPVACVALAAYRFVAVTRRGEAL